VEQKFGALAPILAGFVVTITGCRADLDNGGPMERLAQSAGHLIVKMNEAEMKSYKVTVQGKTYTFGVDRRTTDPFDVFGVLAAGYYIEYTRTDTGGDSVNAPTIALGPIEINVRGTNGRIFIIDSTRNGTAYGRNITGEVSDTARAKMASLFETVKDSVEKKIPELREEKKKKIQKIFGSLDSDKIKMMNFATRQLRNQQKLPAQPFVRRHLNLQKTIARA
jgi:hypothetical protein